MNFDSLKEKFSAFTASAGEKTKGLFDNAGEKTKAAGRLAKLTVDLTREKDALKKAYTTIGQAYFENNREEAEGLLAQLCEEAEAVTERIAAMEAEIEQLKAGFAPAEKEETDVEVSFEEVVEETEKEAAEACEACCEAAEEVIEEAAEAVEDAVEEAAEVIEDAVEEIIE